MMHNATARLVLAALAVMLALSTLDAWAVVGESDLIVAGGEITYQGIDFLAGKFVLGFCLVLVLSLALPSSPGIKALVVLATIALVVVVATSWVNLKSYAADETLRAASAEAAPGTRPLLNSGENRRALIDTTERASGLHASAVLALISVAALGVLLLMSRSNEPNVAGGPQAT